MNGSWYRWGANERTNPSNRTDYLDLWEDMYDTSTKELNLDNLIWVYGPNASSEGYGKYNEMEIIAKLMGKAAWFLQWHSWKDADVAIIDNLRFKEMMNSPSAITLKY